MDPVLPSLRDLLLHQPPMLFLDSVLEMGSEYCRTEKIVNPEDWFALKDGSMPAWVGIELMAQTIAAWSGHEKCIFGGLPKPGYLLGTRRYKNKAPSFSPGTKLEIEVRREFKDSSGLGAFMCKIFVESEVVAEAIVKVFEKSEQQE